jgi:TPR repeat protein
LCGEFEGGAVIFGDGVAEDEAAAEGWYRKAAAQGMTEAKDALRDMRRAAAGSK